MIYLTFRTVTTDEANRADHGFFVSLYTGFDVYLYAEVFGLNVGEIDVQDVHSVEDAASRLNDREWLEVTHEVRDL